MPMKKQIIIYQIKKVNLSGEWIEFWLGENEDGSWDQCCKQYMFWVKVEEANLYMETINKGVEGLYMAWDGDRPKEVSFDAGYILKKYITSNNNKNKGEV